MNDPHDRIQKMKRNRSEKGTELKEGTITRTVLTEFIRETSLFDRERMELVETILTGLEGGSTEVVENQIYLYGSRIKEGELFARQLFLWLWGMLEEKE